MRRRGVTAKVWMSIGVFALGYVLSIAFRHIQSIALESRLQQSAESLFPAAQKAQATEAGFQRMTKLYRDAVMTEDAEALDQARQEGVQLVAHLRAMAELTGLPRERSAAAASLAASLQELVSLSDRTYRAAVAAKGNLDDAVLASMKQSAAMNEQAKSGLEKLVQQTSDDLRAELAGAVSSSARQRWLGLAIFAITFLSAGVLVHLTINRAIRDPLNNLTGRLNASSQEIAQATDQLSRSSNALASEASQQAASLEEASASSQEVNSMAHSNAANAGKASEMMQEAGRNFESINAAHGHLVAAMTEIGQSSSKISKIIKVIDEIAFQTNILALNAAVEAARAGEAGMGFAVVADEVRNLAQRSAQAARDTSSLIEESVSRSATGQSRLEVVTQLLESNARIAGDVSVLVEGISRASSDQAQGIEQIMRTVHVTSQGTQRTAANAQQGAASVESMGAQVRELNDVVTSLHMMVEG